MEIISTINPAKSIYIPHDLQSPYGESNTNENKYLDIYDYIISPFKEDEIKKTLKNAKVIYGGWVKYFKSNKFKIKDKNIRNVYFISNFHYIKEKYSPIELVDFFTDIKNHTYIKFPYWNEVEKYEEELISAGFKIIPSYLLSTDIINSFDNIVCDNVGSIFAESNYLGKKCYFFKTKIFKDFQSSIIKSSNLSSDIIITGKDFLNLKKTSILKNDISFFDFGLIASILNSKFKI